MPIVAPAFRPPLFLAPAARPPRKALLAVRLPARGGPGRETRSAASCPASCLSATARARRPPPCLSRAARPPPSPHPTTRRSPSPARSTRCLTSPCPTAPPARPRHWRGALCVAPVSASPGPPPRPDRARRPRQHLLYCLHWGSGAAWSSPSQPRRPPAGPAAPERAARGGRRAPLPWLRAGRAACPLSRRAACLLLSRWSRPRRSHSATTRSPPRHFRPTPPPLPTLSSPSPHPPARVVASPSARPRAAALLRQRGPPAQATRRRRSSVLVPAVHQPSPSRPTVPHPLTLSRSCSPPHLPEHPSHCPPEHHSHFRAPLATMSHPPPARPIFCPPPPPRLLTCSPPLRPLHRLIPLRPKGKETHSHNAAQGTTPGTGKARAAAPRVSDVKLDVKLLAPLPLPPLQPLPHVSHPTIPSEQVLYELLAQDQRQFLHPRWLFF